MPKWVDFSGGSGDKVQRRNANADFVMPWGKYKQKTLDQIASTDDGLKYLDWAAGEWDESDVQWAVVKYLEDPAIQQDLRNMEDEHAL